MSIIEQTPQIEVPTVSNEEEHRRDVLLRAAELIETVGYTTGNKGMRENGPYCLLGAVGRAMGIPADDTYSADGEHHEAAYSYDVVQEFVGGPNVLESEEDTAWQWSDSQQEYRNPAGRVAGALRRMANGASFEEATR